ncbi:MAG: hypothetical protein WDZ41_01110 [Candidatus Babeliales bacterium]
MKFNKIYRSILLSLLGAFFISSSAQAFSWGQLGISSIFNKETVSQKIEGSAKYWPILVGAAIAVPVTYFAYKYFTAPKNKPENSEIKVIVVPKKENIPVPEIIVSPEDSNNIENSSQREESNTKIETEEETQENIGNPLEPIEDPKSSENQSHVPSEIPWAKQENEDEKPSDELTMSEENGFVKLSKLESEKINNGLNHYSNIKNSNYNNGFDNLLKDKDHLTQITELLHYFYALAENKNQEFNEGTFVIQDSNFGIFEFLKSYVDKKYQGINAESPAICFQNLTAYPRPSSHFNQYYEQSNKVEPKPTFISSIFSYWGLDNAANSVKSLQKKEAYIHYGIDIDKQDIFLPVSNKRHILFGKVDEEKQLIFIKMENHGIGNVQDAGLHCREFGHSILRKLYPQWFGSDDEQNMRKERVPQAIFNKFKSILNNCEDYASADIKEIRKKAKGLGIQLMYREAKTIKQNYIDYKKEVPQSVNDFIEDIKNKQYDHLDLRIGQEVILTDELGQQFKV